jgi:predicted transposase YdaD
MREFLQKLKHHRAQKDISEALEQFHSSKNLSEAQRAILTNHSIIMAFSNRCVQQG